MQSDMHIWDSNIMDRNDNEHIFPVLAWCSLQFIVG